ncbi:MAG: COX15/CtaA family protein [Bacteroidia bacterium]|nr:COX15/CtaA family protein [Bacteroidia bacterium]
MKAFVKWNYVVLATILLVIIAGSVVRMTQSGMGCPDWPKCFGRWIPPTTESQLPFNYKELYQFKYVDTSFNVYHTWVEYINRLLGALLGVFVLIQLGWSFKFIKTHRSVMLLSLLLVVLTGFQAWLGKLVVDANLASIKITIHLIGALVIAAVSLTSIFILNNITLHHSVSKRYKVLSIVALLVLVLQLMLGTLVRAQIDEISFALQFLNRELWIDKLNYLFYIHRSSSLVFLALLIYMYSIIKNNTDYVTTYKILMGSVLTEIALGIVLAYFAMPALAQPAHLLCATVLFLALTYNVLLSFSFKNNP